RQCRIPNEHCATAGQYALVGTYSFLGRLIRITLSLVVLLSELYHRLFYIVPLMVTPFTLKWVEDAFQNRETYRFTLKAGEAIPPNRLRENLH
ncbi:unnamed protein product, partial [Rotaria sp. Silwood2]